MEIALHPRQESIVMRRLRIAQHERRHSCRVRPERQNQNVHHQPHMLQMRLRNPRHRPVQRELAFVNPPLLRLHGRFQPPLHGSHRFKILVQPRLVSLAPLRPQRTRLFQHHVQDRRIVPLQRVQHLRRLRIHPGNHRPPLIPEQPVKRQLRHNFFRDRRLRIGPGKKGAQRPRKSAACRINARSRRVTTDFK